MNAKNKAGSKKRKRLISLNSLIFEVLVAEDILFPLTEKEIEKTWTSKENKAKISIPFKDATQIIKMAESRKRKRTKDPSRDV